MDHDQRLKLLLREYLLDFVALVWPARAADLDPARLEWLPQESFTDPPTGERRVLDIVARVGLRTRIGPHGEIILHVEIESGESLTTLRRRMPRYRLGLTTRHGVPALSMGLYLACGLDGVGWDSATESVWDEPVLQARWPYLGLPEMPAARYLEGANLLGVALSSLMQMDDADRPRHRARALQRIVTEEPNIARRYLLAECVEAYMPLDGPALTEYRNLLTTEDFAMALTIGKTSREEGAIDIVRELLTLRFGPLSEANERRLDALPPDKIRAIGAAILDPNKTLADLGLEPR